MFVLLLNLPKKIRAFSSVGRASPLQGEGQKFESSNAHHKRDDDISYHLFYFVCFDSENLLLKFERGASRVRRIFAKRTKFFEAKSVDTFNASDSRQSSNAHHKKQDDISYPVFYFVILMIRTSNCECNLIKFMTNEKIICHAEQAEQRMKA